MRNKSILLVDDEKSILNSIGEDLREEGYDVSVASSGEEAISQLQDNQYDLVVTDLSMPGLGGNHVLEEAKKIDPMTGVIILTGYGDMASAIDALRLGADDFMLKPCESVNLIFPNPNNKMKQHERINPISFNMHNESFLAHLNHD